jgi:hypothetical protein
VARHRHNQRRDGRPGVSGARTGPEAGPAAARSLTALAQRCVMPACIGWGRANTCMSRCHPRASWAGWAGCSAGGC